MSVRSIKLALVVVFAACATTALAHSGGPSPGYTGAPGEFTCRECHNSFPLDDGVGSVAIEGVPASYTPGDTYTITVRVARADRARWGFQMTALTGALDGAGSFQLVDADKTQLRTDDGKTYVEHKTAGTYAGTTGGASWTVKWTAPAAGTGVVDFYAAGNASNNSGTDKGDNIYTTFAETAETVVSQPFSDVTSAAGLGAAPGGTGVAWADYDGDGRLDFALASASGLLLYRNAGGTSFSETSAAAGLAVPGARAAAWGDANGDGRPDLLVATATGARLFTNTTSGFADATAALGASAAGAASSVAWVDYDGDGRLDAFLGLDAGAALLHDDGGGAFTDATEAAGLGGVAGAKVAAWADSDGDGRADLFVATSGGARLFRQKADGTFEDVTAAAGLGSLSGVTDAAWIDADGDGRLDLALATSGGARLFAGDGLAFRDTTAASGLSGVAAATVAADDSDGDGRVDLLFSAPGGVRLMRGVASGFADKTGDAGVSGLPGGVAVWADADGDGRVDLLGVGASDVALYRNPSVAQTLAVRATLAGGADALGSRLAFDGAGTQVRVLSGGGSAAQAPARAVFASPSPATGVVGATFPGGVGRERMATTGVGAKLSLERPSSAPGVTAVAVVTKDGVDKLRVDGAAMRTNVTVVEVDGERLDTTKYPKKRTNPDGTSSRIVATDSTFDRLVPRGERVLVTVLDTDTGVRSAPVPFTR